jgi:Zn-dependent membrane protease YugP
MNHITLITGFIGGGSAWLLMIVIGLASLVVQWRFKSKFNKYAEIPLLSGMSGREVAERMLRDNGTYDVQVISVDGQLTDHYNSETKKVNLSPDVSQPQRSICRRSCARVRPCRATRKSL